MAIDIKWEQIRGNLDRIVFGLIFLLFLAVLITFISEMSSPGPEYLEPPLGTLEPFIEEEQYNKVKVLLQDYSALDKSEHYASLGLYNMFDYKVVRDRDMIRKEIDEKYEEAEALYNKGQVNYAKDILKNILVTWPSHLKAQALMKKILEQEKKEEVS